MSAAVLDSHVPASRARAEPLDEASGFTAAYAALRSPAVAAAHGVLRDRAAAEDVVQEVFLDLWRRPRQFEPARGSLRSYVCMLARCRAVDRWRATAVREAALARSALDAGSSSPRDEDAAAATLRAEGSRQLVTLVSGLPGSQRQAVLLAYGAAMTSREIADAVGVPVGTAKSRIRLGLGRLRHAEAGLSSAMETE